MQIRQRRLARLAVMSAGVGPLSSPSLSPATTSAEPSNALFMENGSMLYTPSTPVKNYPMDIDGSTPRKIEAVDMDTTTPRKIEAMDTDECAITPSKIQSTADNFYTENFLYSTVTRILRISFQSEKSCIILSSIWPTHPVLTSISYMDSNCVTLTVSNLIMEALDLIMYSVDKPTQLFQEGSQINCLQYLIDCYSRMEEHEKKYSKKCSISTVKELLVNIKTELCSALALLLEGFLTEPVKKNYYNMLYEHLKRHTLPSEFFFELVHHLEADTVRFQKIFSPLLLVIRKESQKGSVSDSSHTAALQVLCDLCECRTGASSSIRPFCNLMIKLGNWLVEPLTEATGREFAKFTFLGPFLCTSLFAEDDSRIAEKLQTSTSESRPMVSSLQQELELTRNLLHKVIISTRIVWSVVALFLFFYFFKIDYFLYFRFFMRSWPTADLANLHCNGSQLHLNATRNAL